MAIAFEEIGRRGGVDEQLIYDGDRVYFVQDVADEGEAITTALAQLVVDNGGTTAFGSPLFRIEPEETDSPDNYRVRFMWRPNQTRQQEGDGPRVAFEFGGETVNIKRAYATDLYGTRPADFGGAIGVDVDDTGNVSVNGVDVLQTSFKFSKTVTLNVSEITNTFLNTIASVFMKTNNSTFAGFPAGEVLFMDVSGGQRGSELFEVTYKFAQRPNETGITIGEITDISKQGWQYLEVQWGKREDATFSLVVPEAIAVRVHTVYLPGNLSILGV